MKKIIFTFALFTAITPMVFSQVEPVPASIPTIAPPSQNIEFVQFTKKTHDFGNIKQGVPVSFTFEYKNVGTKSITIDNVNASCGCTTPNWKGGEYKVGETGQITATFNAASKGFFSKVVTVSTSEGPITLTIQGTVMDETEYNAWKKLKDEQDAKLKAEQEAFAKTKEGKKAAKLAAKKAKADAKAAAKKAKADAKAAKK